MIPERSCRFPELFVTLSLRMRVTHKHTVRWNSRVYKQAARRSSPRTALSQRTWCALSAGWWMRDNVGINGVQVEEHEEEEKEEKESQATYKAQPRAWSSRWNRITLGGEPRKQLWSFVHFSERWSTSTCLPRQRLTTPPTSLHLCVLFYTCLLGGNTPWMGHHSITKHLAHTLSPIAPRKHNKSTY